MVACDGQGRVCLLYYIQQCLVQASSLKRSLRAECAVELLLSSGLSHVASMRLPSLHRPLCLDPWRRLSPDSSRCCLLSSYILQHAILNAFLAGSVQTALEDPRLSRLGVVPPLTLVAKAIHFIYLLKAFQ
jgi:hypothetical protein